MLALLIIPEAHSNSTAKALWEKQWHLLPTLHHFLLN